MSVRIRERILAGAKCCVTTVITETFLSYAAALRQSLHRSDCPPAFLAFVVDPTDDTALPDWALPLQALESTLPRVQQMCVRFQGESDANALRWSLKSQAMQYCINHGAERVLWCDPDLYFFEDPAILFRMIEPRTVLLTPHYRALRPSTCPINFSKNYTEGLFQAGFVGLGSEAATVLDWWAEACLWKMEKSAAAGLYVDQKFLDLLPVCWPDTTIVRHRGCNLAEWNQAECRRDVVNGRVLINGTDPVVFIHFTDWTIEQILTGVDPLLAPHLEEYLRVLRQFAPEVSLRRPVAASVPVIKTKTRPATQSPGRRLWRRVRRMLFSR